MSVTGLAGTPITMAIGDRSYKIKKMSIMDIFETFETEAKESWIKDINSLAKALPAADRRDFLAASIKEMPTGAKLEQMAQERSQTSRGGLKMLGMVLRQCQEVSDEDLLAIAKDGVNGDDIGSVMAYALSAPVAEGVANEASPKVPAT